MNDICTRSAYAIAIAGGALLWFAAAAIGGKREAWDASIYWVAAYPLSIALAAFLGYRAPRKAWRWALAIMLAQAVALAIASSDFGLLPLGLIVFAVLSLPAIAAALLAARLRVRIR